MAEVKITITAEDGTKTTFKAVEQNGKSAFDGIKNSAVETATKTGASFDALGIKSTAALNAQKSAVNAAYAQIKNSATSTADEIIRAEAARAQKIEQIDQQNFAVRKGLLNGFKEHWLAVTGAMIAAWVAVNKAVDYMKMAAQALQAEASFRQVTAAYGEAGDALLKKMKEVSRGMIDDSDLQQKAVKSLQQHLSGKDIVNLLEISRSSARTAGQTVSDAFEGITTAIENQTVRGLKQYGIVIDQGRAFETYAAKIGKAKDALNEEQQTQALVNAALEEGRRQMKGMGEMTENAFEKIQKAEAQMQEFKETVGKGLLITVQALGAVFYVVAAAAMEAAAGVIAVAGALAYMAGFNPLVALTSIGKRLRDFGRAAIEEAKNMHGAAAEVAGKSQEMGAVLASAWEKEGNALAGVAEKATDAAEKKEKLRKEMEASLPVYSALSEAASGVGTAMTTFAGERLSEGLADQHEGLDANRAALIAYRGELSRVSYVMQFGSMTALPALIRANDAYAKALQGITVTLDGVKAGYGRYLATLDEAASRQIQYRQKLKTALEAEMQAAYGQSKTLGDQFSRAAAQQQTEIIKVEQVSAQTRLQAYTKYYDELKRLYDDAFKRMADKVREQAELEKTLLATRKSAADLTFELQKKLMTSVETYYATLERNEQALAQANLLAGRSKIDALEEYKRAVAGAATEVKEGDNVVISSSEAVAYAIGKIADAQQAVEAEAALMAAENDTALEAMQKQVIEIENAMISAQSAVEGLRQQIVSLDAQIAARRVLEIDVSQAVSSLSRVQRQLANILASASQAGAASQSVVAPQSSGSASQSVVTPQSSGSETVAERDADYYDAMNYTPAFSFSSPIPYASGTSYVPETGFYQLHQGERVLNPRESAQYAKRENAIISAQDAVEGPHRQVVSLDDRIYISSLERVQQQLADILSASSQGYNGRASDSGYSLPIPYASGASYVPETGFYQLHQGERVLNPRESAQYSRGNSIPVSINIPSITVITKEGDDPRALARKMVKPLQEELRRLQYLQ